jgi:CheY-like chemotaxis protein
MATVLVVDDDESFREALGLLLRDEGYQVVEVPDGEQAVAWLARRDFDSRVVMLLDLSMPVMTGYEVLESLKERGLMQAVDVIVTTTADQWPKGLRCVPKPFSIDDLLRSLAEVCKRPLRLPIDVS